MSERARETGSRRCCTLCRHGGGENHHETTHADVACRNGVMTEIEVTTHIHIYSTFSCGLILRLLLYLRSTYIYMCSAVSLADMDGHGWVTPAFHPLSMGPPSAFQRYGRSKNPDRAGKAPHLVPHIRDESRAFVHHTRAHRAHDLVPKERQLAPAPAPSSGRLHTAASAPSRLHSALGEREPVKLPSTPCCSRGRSAHQSSGEGSYVRPAGALASRPDTVGPPLAYTNYMALGTPAVKQWTRTPRGQAALHQPRPAYYATHESARAPPRRPSRQPPARPPRARPSRCPRR